MTHISSLCIQICHCCCNVVGVVVIVVVAVAIAVAIAIVITAAAADYIQQDAVQCPMLVCMVSLLVQ